MKLTALVAAALVLSFGAPANAQSYPNRPITWWCRSRPAAPAD